MARAYDDDLHLRFATRAIHAGQRPDPLTGAVMTPIYQTSTYVQEGIDQHKGFVYARTRNPTRDALERAVAALEAGAHGFAFGSGLAGVDAIMKLFEAGDHVVCGQNVYGGTYRLMDLIYRRLGIDFTFVDTRSIDRVAEAVTTKTKLLFVETPTNPMMHLADLRACAELAADRDILLVVDNTFATPYFQRPLEHGAHVVFHSTTKYLNGHSDMIGGIVVTTRDDVAQRLEFIQNSAGAVPGPFDCWLALRGLKTLPVRMRQHETTARQIATWLEGQHGIRTVVYPGLPSHPQYELARQQMCGSSGMVTVLLDTAERARKFAERTRIFALAESLGGVESLITHPTTMTHSSVPPAMREAMGLTDELVRLSVGLEDPDDLIADLAQALERSA
jgi:cystathionine beta-lyase/cystathionine gamma-synthase